jgi:hypothetical protein
VIPPGNFNHAGDILGREWKDDDIGQAGGVPRFAPTVMFELGRVDRAPFTEKHLEIGGQRGSCRV